jgi:hypothetical protein
VSDPFAARARLETGDGPVELYRLAEVAELDRLPHTVKILLENLLRVPAPATSPRMTFGRSRRGRERSATADLAFMPHGS